MKCRRKNLQMITASISGTIFRKLPNPLHPTDESAEVCDATGFDSIDTVGLQKINEWIL